MKQALAVFLAVLNLSVSAVEIRTLNDGNLILEDVPEIPEQIIDDMNRYQNVRSAELTGWSTDGVSIYITTRFANVSQLHRVDKPGGARHQLTFFDEPVGQVALNPRFNFLAFTMDAGGSEYSQIYLMDLKSGDYHMISDGKSRNVSLKWSGDGTQLAYTSTRRNGASNDVWIASVNGSKATGHSLRVASPDGTYWGAVDFSEAGDSLLVQQYISSTNSIIHLKDLQSGEMKIIAGVTEDQSSNFAVSFDKEGDGVFLITDRYSEFTQLAYLDLKNHRETVITGDINWNVEETDISRDKKRIAFTVNESGISRLYLLDTDSLEYARVNNIPTGIIGTMAFNPGGDKLAITINTSKTPSDVFVIPLDIDQESETTLQRWTYSEVGGLDTDSFIEPQLIHYPTLDKIDNKPREIPAFIYKPEGEGPHPVVIYIHGGPESQYRPSFSSIIQLWLQKLGIAFIAPNVRGSSGYGKEYITLDNGFNREDSVRDIGALLDWIKVQGDLDQEKVAVYGGSYGGYMVLASAVHYSDRLKAAVDIVGISNFVTFLENTEDYRRDLRRVEYGDERDPEMRKYLQEISPVNNVDRIRVPLLVAQGQNDPRVPVSESEQVVEALRGNGNKVWYLNALNEGHGFRKKENIDVYRYITVMFLMEHLLK